MDDVAVLGVQRVDLVEARANTGKDLEAIARELFQARFIYGVRVRRNVVVAVAIVAVVAIGVEICRGFDACVRFLFRSRVFVQAVDQFVDSQLTCRDLIRAGQNGCDCRRTCRNRLNHLVQTVFDALGDGDFAGARQQLRGAHFAHIHTHGVGGATEFGVDGRQRNFRFFVRLVVRDYRRVGVEQQRFRIGGRLVDRHTHVVEGGDDGFHRRGLREVVGQVIVDLRVRQIAALLAQLDQRAHLALLLFDLLRCFGSNRDRFTRALAFGGSPGRGLD